MCFCILTDKTDEIVKYFQRYSMILLDFEKYQKFAELQVEHR